MAIGIIFSVIFAVFAAIMSLAFKIAGKLRLTLPLLYIVIISTSTLFSHWVSDHNTLVMAGLFTLIGLVVLSWVYSLVKAIRARIKRPPDNDNFDNFVILQINYARELGIPLGENVRFDKNGYLLYAETGEPVFRYQVN